MLGSTLSQWILSLPGLSQFNGYLSPHSFDEVEIFNDASISSASCCDALKASLGGSTVAFPDDDAYKASIVSYFSLKSADLQPAFIILPANAEEVSAAVKILVQGESSSADKCLFAIRGGGHTPYPGAASLNGGVVIDLKRMPVRGLSSDRKTVTISPSQKWDEVTEELDEYNLSTLGARVAGVGVGGATLSCGTSFFSARYGFICDVVADFEVVLANGEVVHANAHSHSDLWKALRGGGNNFGIVTAITLQTFPQGPFWGGQTFHDISTRKQHFKAHAKLASMHPYDPYVHYINNLVLTNMTGEWFIGSSLQYTKSDPPVVEPDVFRPFLDIEQKPLFPGAPSNTIRVDNVTGISREYAALATYPKRWLFATVSFGPSAEMMEEFFQLADKTLRPFLNLDGFSVAMAYQPIPSVMSERNGAVDSLGPVQTQGDLVYVHLAVSVDDNESHSDDDLEKAVETLISKAESRAKELGVYRSYLQATYAETWQNPLLRRSKSTLEDLWVVSRKYDPHQVFQKQVPGGFKLPKFDAEGKQYL
ncbi:FAD-dependent monooxygenase CTB5 [Pseudocercospora fuligena]|uniref:FAD-dependent monooxygenase CTB5 n=1 Tax=Pseudocercospora fuligena TaxID=685502 RepID=A0A8H6VPN3_9PEZI|nr:FAD-dependent monooxygenase CTB5 [Pseudocercospora fuligena]